MSTSKSQAITGMKWSAIERVSVQAIQFIIGLILARRLSPEEFGVMGMLTIFIAVSQVIIDSGFANALVRKLDCNDDDYSTALYCNLGISLLCYLLLFFTAPAIASFYSVQLLTELLRMQALVLIFNSLTIVQVAKLTRDLNFKTQTLIGLTATLVSGAIGIWCAYHEVGVWSLAYQALSCAVINATLFWCFGPFRLKLRFSIQSFRDLFGYGSKLLVAGVIGSIYNHITTLVIGRFFRPADLGYYSRGQQFASVPSITVTNILSRVTFPIFSRLQNDDQALVRVYRKYICLSSLVIFFGLALLSGVARPMILLLLGERWEPSVLYLQLFCFALMMDHICSINLSLLQVKGRSDLYLRLEIIKKTISFAILFASIPFGIVAVCCSRIIYSQLSVIINTYYTGKFFGLGYFAQIRDFGPYLLAAILASLPSYWLSSQEGNHLFWMLAGIVTTTILYLLFVHRDKYFKELTKLRKNI